LAGWHEISELAFKHDTMGIWSIRVQPKHMERAHPRALEISGYNKRDWADAPPIEEMWGRIVAFLTDVIIVGHNVAGFDLAMLEGESRMKRLDRRDISRAWEDTQGLAMTLLVPRGLKRVSLKACCDYYGIGNQGQHHALEDVLRTEQVYKRITQGQQGLFDVRS
jgi:DNA polymerase III epsilon subunit-like protein